MCCLGQDGAVDGHENGGRGVGNLRVHRGESAGRVAGEERGHHRGVQGTGARHKQGGGCHQKTAGGGR